MQQQRQKQQWETHKLIETKTQTQNGKKKKKLNQAAAVEEATTNKTQKKFKRNWPKKNCWRGDPKNSQFIWVSKKLQNSHLKS